MGEGRRVSEEATFELRAEGERGTGYGNRLATASAKALRQERKQHVLRTERPKWMEPGDQGGKTARYET